MRLAMAWPGKRTQEFTKVSTTGRQIDFFFLLRDGLCGRTLLVLVLHRCLQLLLRVVQPRLVKVHGTLLM